MLLDCFRGRKLMMQQVYQEHNVGRPFIKRNYKEALRSLEAQGRIAAVPPAKDRKAGTFADDVLVQFPLR